MNFGKTTLFLNAPLTKKSTSVGAARALLWLALTLLTPFCSSQLAYGSALSDLAASMQPGTWAVLTTTNFASGDILRAPAGGSAAEYMDEAHWNPLNNTVMFLGASHPSGPFTGDRFVFAKYTESTNAWTLLTTPTAAGVDTSNSDPNHVYRHATIDPNTGDIYHRQYYTGKVMKYSHAAQTWSQCSVWGTGNYQVAGSLEYFPDRNSLIFLDGNWGVWELSLASGNCLGTWTEIAGIAGVGGPTPQLSVGSYHNQSRYSWLCQCVVLGGGNGSTNLYLYHADGTWTTAASPPAGLTVIAVPPTGTIFTVDPVTGLLLFWGYSDATTTMYEYNPSTDTWNTIARTSPMFPGPEGGVSETVAIPIPNYGVIMFASSGSSSGGKIYLYRHSPGTKSPSPPSDTVAPSIPSGVSSVAVSATQINISWAASTDNVGVQGYKIYRGGAQVGVATTSAYSDSNLSSSTSYTYTVAAYDAAGNTSGQSAPSTTTTQIAVTTPPPSGSTDFATRCAQPGVVRCFSFDTTADLGGNYGNRVGRFNNAGNCTPPNYCPEIDTTVKAGGAGSMRFTVPTNDSAGSAGQWFANFTDDLSVTFGANSEFWYQWRQRMTSGFINLNSGGGWKISMVGDGDKPACTPSTSAGNCATSCSAIELVTNNGGYRGFLQMYNACGVYAGFEEYVPPTDFKLQNGRPSPYCLYSQGKTDPKTFFPPAGNCIAFVPDEWVTYTVKVTLGDRTTINGIPVWAGNQQNIKVWIARDGQARQLAHDWSQPIRAPGGTDCVASDPCRYGKIWLTPYSTGANGSVAHPTAYTWYDELIIATQDPGDPGASGGGGTVKTQPPTAPSSLSIQ